MVYERLGIEIDYTGYQNRTAQPANHANIAAERINTEANAHEKNIRILKNSYTINQENPNLVEDYNFVIKGYDQYVVDERFPRIKREDISDVIENAKYSLVLYGIRGFKEG